MADPSDPTERYSALWETRTCPDLDAFLAEAGAVTPQELSDLVVIDQRERWRAGDQAPVEDYFRRYPQLREDPGLALDLVYGEVLLREGQDGAAADAELSRRFPDLADALKVQVDLHRALTPREVIAEATPLPPRFGRYEIRRQLGRGGMGTVYLAHDTRLNRLVALKVPNLGGDPDAARRFVREARAAAALQNPNICPVYDSGAIDGRPFLTMAYLDGGSLADRLPLPVGEAVKLVRTLADALDEAHRAGVMHRDLKPANVLFNGKGQPVITDFGLARQLAAAGPESLSGPGIVGTPAYMAPEQVNGDAGAIGPATDVYALGVVLYEALTGRRPFEGPLGTLLARITTDEPEPPSRLRPDVDARLSAVCLRALAKKPTDRFPAMAAFAAALNECVAGRRGRAAARRRPIRRAALALAVAGVLLGGGVLIWRPWKADGGGAPSGPVARDPAAARVLAEKAWTRSDEGDLDGALAESGHALQLDEECVPALLCRANALIQKKEFGPAITDLDRAARFDPKNPTPEVDLAWAHNELGDHDRALVHADRAIALKLDSAEAHYQRGGAHMHKGMYDEAIRDLTKAIGFKDDYVLAYRERAAAHKELGQHALAAADTATADELEAANANRKR
jgi:tetratricopeptide (TPR) repeat protein